MSELILVGKGYDRVTYKKHHKSKYVRKFPRHEGHDYANRREAELYQRGHDIPLAKCRLHKPSGVLIMEYVENARFSTDEDHDLPDWVNSIDCQQVGYNRKGELVCYDYGNE